MSPAPQGGILVISGIRRLLATEEGVVEGRTMHTLRERRPAFARVGGAVGVDLVAFRTLADWRMQQIDAARKAGAEDPFAGALRIAVFAPGRASDLVPEYREIAARCGARIVELGMPLDRPASFHARNRAMLSGVLPGEALDPEVARKRRADFLLAFRSVRDAGGTYQTIQTAHELRIPHHAMTVREAA